MLTNLFAASLLALQSAAFLVVPDTKGPVHHGGSNHLNLHLQCHECPFPTTSEGSVVVFNDAFDSWLPLNFSTKGNTLFVNEQPIFPMVRRPTSLQGVLHRQSDMKVSPPVQMGYGLEFQVVDGRDSASNLLLFHFTVIDLAGFPVPVSTVYLPIIQSPNGDLLIVTAKANILSMPRKSWRQCRRNRRCLKHLILARIRAFFITAKVRALSAAKKLSFKGKGCHRKPHGVGSPHHHERPSHQMKPHGGSSHRQHKSMSFAHRFCHVLKTVFLPGLIGIVATISVVIIGIQLACGFAAVRAYCNRRRTRPIADQEQGEIPEKEALMADEQPDLPPQYHEGDYGNITLPAEKE
ncbi:predicted protein [Uncinocarpus reesii 1704]|uniref:DUF7728 domain-containing protein n=1 Tax=Uncinocarpus reesii (strain UAMH 1704) TaxID=336963 RepID=C4JN59_UNCRE|nr:uncharacterized protein UREG_04267 [Uncinocarpus reesii 1704]EEP79421.1 predicted protein [Uncinocarpus reesii 1704]